MEVVGWMEKLCGRIWVLLRYVKVVVVDGVGVWRSISWLLKLKV